MVTAHGCRVIGSQSARTAINEERRESPPAIVINVRHKGRDALDVLRELDRL